VKRWGTHPTHPFIENIENGFMERKRVQNGHLYLQLLYRLCTSSSTSTPGFEVHTVSNLHSGKAFMHHSSTLHCHHAYIRICTTTAGAATPAASVTSDKQAHPAAQPFATSVVHSIQHTDAYSVHAFTLFKYP